MKEEYDFSKSIRGKFYRPNTTLNLLVYLDNKVRIYCQACVQAKSVDVSQLVNEMLKQDIKLIETVKS